MRHITCSLKPSFAHENCLIFAGIGSGLHCYQFLIFTYAYALIFIHRCFGSLFWLLGVLIRSLFHKKGVLIGSLSQRLGVLISFGGSAYPICQQFEVIKILFSLVLKISINAPLLPFNCTLTQKFPTAMKDWKAKVLQQSIIFCIIEINQTYCIQEYELPPPGNSLA